MKTDRDLLEAAAKAAGVEGKWHEQTHAYAAPTGWLMPNGRTWNPLTDDGDALRLAVKLGLEVDPDPALKRTVAHTHDMYCGAAEPHRADSYAATRRAVVRAAAAMVE